MKLIDVTGTAAERGQSYGSAAQTEIKNALATYKVLFEIKGISWENAIRTAVKFRPFIEGFDADSMTEIEAIARGAKCDVNEIILLNARTELMYWYSAKSGVAQAESHADECTGLIVRGSATRQGQVIHAQNWDWMPEVARHTIALRIRDYDGPNALHFVEAGQLARHGLNESGIAVSAMGLHSDRDYGRLGVPSPVLRRAMIHAKSMGDAIATLHDHDTSFSHAITLSHASGEAFCFETFPGGVVHLEPENDILVHANHFKSDRALTHVKDVNLVRCADSLHRDQRLRRLLTSNYGALDTATITAALADETHAPNSLCRAPASRMGGLSSATVYSLVMLPATGDAHITMSPWEEKATSQAFSIN